MIKTDEIVASDEHLFPALKQNVGPHKPEYDREVWTAVTRCLWAHKADFSQQVKVRTNVKVKLSLTSHEDSEGGWNIWLLSSL